MDKYSYLSNCNGGFIDDLYVKYKRDPQSIEKSWQRFFEGFEFASQRSDLDNGSLRDKEAAVMKLINAYRDRGHLVARINPVKERELYKADLNLEHFRLTGRRSGFGV